MCIYTLNVIRMANYYDCSVLIYGYLSKYSTCTTAILDSGRMETAAVMSRLYQRSLATLQFSATLALSLCPAAPGTIALDALSRRQFPRNGERAAVVEVTALFSCIIWAQVYYSARTQNYPKGDRSASHRRRVC
jgi:hypothetical protein